MLAFSEDLHTDLGVAIGRREGFGATTGREAISAQDIGFLGVAADKDSDAVSKEGSEGVGVAGDSATNFGDVGGEEVTDRGNEAGGVEGEAIDCCEAGFDSEVCAEGEIVFGFFACRVRICSCSLVLLSNLAECLQRLHVYPSARFLARRASSCCFINSFASCLTLLFICNSCLRK